MKLNGFGIWLSRRARLSSTTDADYLGLGTGVCIPNYLGNAESGSRVGAALFVNLSPREHFSLLNQL